MRGDNVSEVNDVEVPTALVDAGFYLERARAAALGVEVYYEPDTSSSRMVAGRALQSLALSTPCVPIWSLSPLRRTFRTSPTNSPSRFVR